MIRKLLYIICMGLLFPVSALSQINTDRVMTIGKNALYFEDYVLSIQYFNQVINANLIWQNLISSVDWPR